MNLKLTKVQFLNVKIDNLTAEEALIAADNLVQQRKNAFIVTPNVDHLVLLEQNEKLRNAYSNADLTLADGMPIIWFSKFFSHPIKEKISGSDFLPKLCELASKKGYKMFFLGANEGVAEKAAQNLVKTFPSLQIAGHYSPPIGFENSPTEIVKIDQLLATTKPDILAVALGCPKQEILINENKDRWDIPLCLGIGASLDFAAGTMKRAPKWMSNHGLEWFYRMCQEPRRMFKRYIFRDWKFLQLLWKYRKNK